MISHKQLRPAVEALRKLDVDFLTIHASGGKKMMRVAKEAAQGWNLAYLRLLS